MTAIRAVAVAIAKLAVNVCRDVVTADGTDGLAILEVLLVPPVASLPAAMPAVFSITVAVGALRLSKRQGIVSKLSAFEGKAGPCTHKTGTYGR